MTTAKQYIVYITEQVVYKMIIEAETRDEARQIAEESSEGQRCVSNEITHIEVE